jgi:hypothetical protein
MQATKLPVVNGAGQILLSAAALCIANLVRTRFLDTAPGKPGGVRRSVISDLADTLKDTVDAGFTAVTDQNSEEDPFSACGSTAIGALFAALPDPVGPTPTTLANTYPSIPGRLSNPSPPSQKPVEDPFQTKLVNVVYLLHQHQHQASLVALQKKLAPDSAIDASTVDERKGSILFSILERCNMSDPSNSVNVAKALVILNQASRAIKKNLTREVP